MGRPASVRDAVWIGRDPLVDMEIILVLAFLTIVLIGLAQLFFVVFSPEFSSKSRKTRRFYGRSPVVGASEADVDTHLYHGPPDYRKAMWEASVEEMGWSAYTAVIRGILEGPGTDEEKEMARRKFIAACEMGPEERAAVTEIRARAKRQTNIAPWQQG
jgi:hypothetical protein